MKPPISLSLSATLLLLTLYPAKSTAWLPWSNKNITSTNGTNLFEQTNGKIRGVNLASLFVLEPWMAPSEWSSMGCADTKSEFDCVLHLGQNKADASFRQHWDTWITREDLHNITTLGLNTVRVPVGYWLYEELVDRESEYFPRGGWEFFERVCRWAAEEGVYVIVDLHGAPGAQVAMNPDTGQYAPSPGFYNAYQYDRAETFLAWLTAQIHSNSNFSTVGMIELVNEPIQNPDQVASMRTDFYPNAIAV
ncbi:hypothetical protein MPDQ_004425 [Monascus purpureus]|uniref:glucan endo-1,6-beta-glucosidase n=1 Tax=Monascus purpureus TaxID=5098 RepID=A0A507QLE9_MONPU|nr:hypothetical protein MPDQ_004425 [Monascus purpureus]